MKTLNQLYLILWDNIKDLNYIGGLCYEINYLLVDKISNDEYELLIKDLKNQKPNENQHSEFLESPTWRGGAYWWKDEEDINPINRKLFIKKMIKITSKQ
jgi:hypothetical protein